MAYNQITQIFLQLSKRLWTEKVGNLMICKQHIIGEKNKYFKENT